MGKDTCGWPTSSRWGAVLVFLVTNLPAGLYLLAWQVQQSMSLERAYIMFRNMGLRHLIVVDDYNRVKGIVTRKDLLGFKLDEAVSRALLRVESFRHLGECSWLSMGPTAEWNGVDGQTPL